LHVDHYRPKNKYYWLAYSWDNLLLCCPTCNTFKSDSFELEGAQVTFINSEETIAAIHNLRAEYNKSEIPKMVNPEIENPNGLMRFAKNGLIESDDYRFLYTIKTCQIDRQKLNDERRRIIDVFIKDIISALAEASNAATQSEIIEFIVKKFVRDAMDLKADFRAFRIYAISNNWLSEITQDLSNS
jgi:hypothetical protein